MLEQLLHDKILTKTPQHITNVYLQKLTSKITQNTNQTISQTEFFGSHPITLSKNHLNDLLYKDYYVCEKTDGIRLMLYVIDAKNNILIFLDRKNNSYFAKATFQTRIVESLFDGELYVERKDGLNLLVFSVYDTILYNNEFVIDYDLKKRLSFALSFVNLVSCTMIKVLVKQMSKSYFCSVVYKNVSSLSHENDGLIFTPVNYPYYFGRCNWLFKWKPGHLNTVDFKMIGCQQADYFYELVFRGKNQGLFVFGYFFDEEGYDEDLNEKIGNQTANVSLNANEKVFKEERGNSRMPDVSKIRNRLEKNTEKVLSDSSKNRNCETVSERDEASGNLILDGLKKDFTPLFQLNMTNDREKNNSGRFENHPYSEPQNKNLHISEKSDILGTENGIFAEKSHKKSNEPENKSTIESGNNNLVELDKNDSQDSQNISCDSTKISSEFTSKEESPKALPSRETLLKDEPLKNMHTQEHPFNKEFTGGYKNISQILRTEIKERDSHDIDSIFRTTLDQTIATKQKSTKPSSRFEIMKQKQKQEKIKESNTQEPHTNFENAPTTNLQPSNKQDVCQKYFAHTNFTKITNYKRDSLDKRNVDDKRLKIEVCDKVTDLKHRYHNKIGEFRYDKDKMVYDLETDSFVRGAWVLHKIRSDKSLPNGYRVIMNILKSIEENITINVLSSYSKKMKEQWDKRHQKNS